MRECGNVSNPIFSVDEEDPSNLNAFRRHGRHYHKGNARFRYSRLITLLLRAKGRSQRLTQSYC